ncbi:MAG: FkbM family methyltransferase [Candidatus Pacebacteria bacterium]|nr:FkbM family methyltransferase [Candidatus Paceibacterota bacterium]
MPEPEAVDFLKTKVRGTVFDIGANYGWYSLIFSGWANVVYSFEPIPSTYKELTDNIALNESKNIIALNSALGNRNEDVEFFCPDVARGSAIASEHNYFGKKVKVCMTTLDDFMKKYSISGVDFIKIDVEGGELNMLKGAEKTLRSFHPDLFLEIESRHAERFGYKSADIFNYLASLGYESREQVENMVYFKSIQ